MTVICNYPTKAILKSQVGEKFSGYDPSVFSTGSLDGQTFSCSNRPQIDGRSDMLASAYNLRKKNNQLKTVREFYARVELDEFGTILKVT